jgi:hypothetical protein
VLYENKITDRESQEFYRRDELIGESKSDSDSDSEFSAPQEGKK